MSGVCTRAKCRGVCKGVCMRGAIGEGIGHDGSKSNCILLFGILFGIIKTGVLFGITNMNIFEELLVLRCVERYVHTLV